MSGPAHRADGWVVTEARTLLETPWFALREESHLQGDGRTIRDYYTLDECDGVNVVVLAPGRELVVVRQYRPAVERVVLDFPAGVMEDADAEPVECARRELAEETGYTADVWLPTGVIDPAPHRLRKREHCFLAIGARRAGPQTPDDNEDLDVFMIGITEIERMIQDGEFTCGVCIASLALAQRRAPELFTGQGGIVDG